MYAYPEHYGNIIIRPVSMYKRVLECSDIEKICYQSLTLNPQHINVYTGMQ